MPEPESESRLPSLLDRVALVTGATKGIGRAVATTLTQAGCHLVVTARHEADLDTLATELHAFKAAPSQQIVTCAGSVSDWPHVQTVAETVQRQFGRLDVLVNNAGMAGKIQLLQEISVEEIDTTLDTNLRGPIYFMKAAIPLMVNQGGGTIININSIAGRQTYPYWSIYCASKFGLSAVTEAVRQEQRQNHIKVVSINPGAVDTPLWKTIEPEIQADHDHMLAAEDVAACVRYVLEQPERVLVEDITLTPQIPAL